QIAALAAHAMRLPASISRRMAVSVHARVVQLMTAYPMYDAARSCATRTVCESRVTPYNDATAVGAISPGTALTRENSAAIEAKVVRPILSSSRTSTAPVYRRSAHDARP